MLDDGGLVILLTIGLVILSIILRLFQSSDRTTTNATPSERVLTSERAIVVESHLLSKTQVFMHRYLPKRHNHRVVTVLANEILVVLKRKFIGKKELELKNSDVLNRLKDLINVADVYIVCHVDSKEEQKRFEAFFIEHEIILECKKGIEARALGRMAKHKLLFSNTTKGRIAIVRQLEPTIHIDHDLQVIQALQPYITRLIHVGAAKSAAFEENVHAARTFSNYFDDQEVCLKSSN